MTKEESDMYILMGNEPKYAEYLREHKKKLKEVIRLVDGNMDRPPEKTYE